MIVKNKQITRVEKPWGYELIWAHTKSYAGKVLHVKKGESLSLQYHNSKTESMLVYKGKIEFESVDGIRIMDQGDAVFIKAGEIHRVKALEDTDIFEVSTPELQDIVRLKDNYGRI